MVARVLVNILSSLNSRFFNMLCISVDSKDGFTLVKKVVFDVPWGVDLVHTVPFGTLGNEISPSGTILILHHSS